MKNIYSFIISLVLITSTALAQSGGPDNYGYTWEQTAGAAAEWVEITTRPGTFDITEQVIRHKLVGPINFSFDFSYFWYSYNSLYISGEGFVSFNPLTLAPGYDDIPGAEGQGNDFLAPLLTPLGYEQPDAKVYFWTDFKDSIVITWENANYMNRQGQDEGKNTFQCILDRETSQITYNYARHEGNYAQTSCPGLTESPIDQDGITNCQLIGYENITGTVGEMISNNDNFFFPPTLSKENPVSIKITPDEVENMNFDVEDIRIEYVTRRGTKGQFISLGGAPYPLKVQYENIGTVKTRSVQVESLVKKGAKEVLPTKKFSLVPALNPGETRLIDTKAKFSPEEAGIYQFDVNIFDYQEDEIFTNNRKGQFIGVVDTTAEITSLDYSGGIETAPGFYYLGSTGFQLGIGVYIEPPFYPIIIDGIKFGVGAGVSGANPQPTDQVRLRIFDDNGENVFGEKDGSPGDMIYEIDLLPTVDFTAGYNTYKIENDTVQLNSGGVYIAMLQGGQGMSFKTRTTSVVSNNTYQSNGAGGFIIYRDRTSAEFLLGMDIRQGELDQVVDMELTEIMNPRPEMNYTDSVEVSINMTNTGPQPISGPLDASYRVNSRDEVRETISADFELAVGESSIYTFTRRAARPSAPKTKFSQFCASVGLPNDFRLGNDTICYVVTNIADVPNQVIALDVFPNPAETSISILTGLRGVSNTTTLKIVNQMGHVVLEKQLGSVNNNFISADIDLPELPAGFYSVVITSDTGRATKKFIVK
ncbi:MAG: hypothetical protein ACI81S_002181 [Sphingobacteriales bacterium]|jgi:hypothetical protein